VCRRYKCPRPPVAADQPRGELQFGEKNVIRITRSHEGGNFCEGGHVRKLGHLPHTWPSSANVTAFDARRRARPTGHRVGVDRLGCCDKSSSRPIRKFLSLPIDPGSSRSSVQVQPTDRPARCRTGSGTQFQGDLPADRTSHGAIQETVCANRPVGRTTLQYSLANRNCQTGLSRRRPCRRAVYRLHEEEV
jgi:hypothetical protein